MGFYFNEYSDYLESEKELSVSTRESYLSDIRQYIDFLHSRNIVDLSHTTNAIAISYMLYLEKGGGAPSTIVRKLSSLRSYYYFLIRQQLIDTDPTANLKSPKNERKIPEALTYDEPVRLLNQPRGGSLKSVRDKAMLELLYATGIRVSELISLNLKDINTEVGYLVCGSPACKERVVPIPAETIQHLKNYIHNARSKMVHKSTEEALFVNTHGRRMTRQGFWKIIKQYKEMANIDKEITPHTLRHSFAVHLMDNGVDIRAVQKILGHSDLSTTQIYSQIQSEMKKQSCVKSHPKLS